MLVKETSPDNVSGAMQPAWWQMPSAQVLVAANVIIAGGVLFGGWPLFPVMFLFWAENVIVGFFNVLRMAASGRSGTAEKVGTIPFFILHYGGFCLGHGVFVVALFAGDELRGYMAAAGGFDAGFVRQLLSGQGVWLGVVVLFASHWFSFARNYLGSGEYRQAEAGKLMGAPYARVMVLHVLILAGGFVIMGFESPTAFVLLLVVLKTAIDVYSHVREHRGYAALEQQGA
jgi:hypothetical protein